MSELYLSIFTTADETSVMWLCMIILTAIVYAISKKRDILMLGVSGAIIFVVSIIKSFSNMSQFVTFLIVYIVLRLVFSEAENAKPVFKSKNAKNLKGVIIEEDENLDDCCSDDL